MQIIVSVNNVLKLEGFKGNQQKRRRRRSNIVRLIREASNLMLRDGGTYYERGVNEQSTLLVGVVLCERKGNEKKKCFIAVKPREGQLIRNGDARCC